VRPIYVLLGAVAILGLVSSVWLFRRNRLSTRVFILWMCLWVLMGIFAPFPALADRLVRLFSMEDRLVFLFMASIVVLLSISFYLSSRVNSLERKLARAIQAMAIMEFELREELTGDRATPEFPRTEVDRERNIDPTRSE